MSAEIARAIKTAIAKGKLQPGDRLPAERELSQALGVSRSSLRDALKVLAGLGVVEVKRNYGVFIAEAEDPHIAVGRAASSLLLQRGPIAELFEIRKLLEAHASAWAAERASSERLAEMGELFAEFSAKAAGGSLTPEEANSYDQDLHGLIASAAGNTFLVQVVHTLRRLQEEARSRDSVLTSRRIAINVADLGAVLDAIRRRDPDRAREAMYEHLARGELANIRPLRPARCQSSSSPTTGKAQR